MGLHQRNHVPFSFLFVILIMVFTSRVTYGADDKDKEECTEQLVGLATCLPYVGGNAKSPTPDCCSGLKQVLNTNKKCLCVVVKDRNDPDLGLTINVTLALGLPTVCHAPANVTKCPELLHLAPNSTEAQVFYQYGRSSSASVPASSPISNDSGNATTAGGSGTSTKRPIGNSSGTSRRTWLQREVILMGVLSCIFTSTFVI
uniref:non-specific lipid transfer protein GPI-anchored 14-like n=1 Tax=Erigeron canadensis TaxID=72917 RepID=UPI001CB947F9|nr:non-specific lipid transfer protein GPI-anchored 14-like [Erigeron canadensis]